MKLSTQLMYAGNPREAADQVRALEDAGLDTVWVPEAYGFDSPTLMGYLAAKTEKVEIGAAILNIYSRTPSALLQTAAGLDNVSQGRAIIGLGASGPQVIEGFHGVPYDKPLGRTKEIIELIRSGLRRETLVHDGIFTLPLPEGQGTGLGKPLKLLTRPERPSIPLYIAALGPKSVEGAAEYADGWLPFLFVPEKAGQVWGDALAAGTAKRQEGLAPLEICAGGMVAIGEGPETKALLDFARPLVALYVGGMGARGKNFYNDLAVKYGYEQEAKEIQDLYLGGNKRDAEAKVPLELLELGNLVGPASYVKERIAAFAEAGRDQPPGDAGLRRPAGDDPSAPRAGRLTLRHGVDADQAVHHVVPALLRATLRHVRDRRVRHGDERAAVVRLERHDDGVLDDGLRLALVLPAPGEGEPPRPVDLGVGPRDRGSDAGAVDPEPSAEPRVDVVRRATELRPPPGGQLFGVGPGGEDPLGRGGDRAGDRDRAGAHGVSSGSAARCCSRRSRALPHIRRVLIAHVARSSRLPGTSRTTVVRPRFSLVTTPAPSSTRRCLSTAGRVTARRSARSLIDASPSASRSRIERRGADATAAADRIQPIVHHMVKYR